ncbi:epithelial cell-transforming sequence 2 oncogene-like isoform X1 [Brienomyrus brachyistius]|uniref:epithelial cell-transforming sequence 2 oncogene-like isoform X1 n=1 Tax=Brienomyrus brachyistius TaxID=42636 RepID=UPI0020B3F7BF|nr:epithelial cell-transforming sequence 2 oncogene-like isoform X1 [Brienomyrus brachyistius]XP_048830773.1 epithelial cell-transforming sequence 2 oncogene-like isoform X1 [Brienomyrus brachyistius]
METLETDLVKSRGRASIHSVKQRHFNAIDFRPALTEDLLLASETRLSTWTPVVNKPTNHQLFQERTTLILHWFDLWTDNQRKLFIHDILRRCSRSQLKFTRDWFMEAFPSTNMDFTSVLPRFLSLYILSFLNPRELCIVAQVCWHWKVLAEQDCHWAPKCMKHGWFLPYTPTDLEYGAWKRHYIVCVSSLDYLTPREAADIYGTLNDPVRDKEEPEERRKERWIRQCIREKVAEHKRGTLMYRHAWLNSSWSAGTASPNIRREKLWASFSQQDMRAALVLLGEKIRSRSSLSLRRDQGGWLSPTEGSLLMSSHVASSMQSLYKGSAKSCRTQGESRILPRQPPLHLLLVSSRVPAYELLLSAARSAVVPLLYDHRGSTLEALLFRVERLLQGVMVQNVAVLAEGDAEELNLLQGCRVTQESVLRPDVREFWERLAGWVAAPAEGASLFIFTPLAASVTGTELMVKLSTLTGLRVCAPTGLATGSYQQILSEWSGGAEFPPRLYFGEAELLSWARQAERLEETLGTIRVQLGPQLKALAQEISGRAVGHFLWDTVIPYEFHANSEVTQALTEGLAALSREPCDNPLQYLSLFLQRRCEEICADRTDSVKTQRDQTGAQNHISLIPQGLHSNANGQAMVAAELLHSEKVYIRLLQAIVRVYYGPLKAALDSNRAILSSSKLLTIFSPILEILEVNTVFLEKLTARLPDQGSVQHVGDVCLKLCSKLRTYTNFFNNYPTVLRTIDRCRVMIPAFRAFLRRHDRTLATSMLSLQELLLLPSSRIEEYLTLFQAFFLYTAPEHPDWLHLSSVLEVLRSYRVFLRKLKQHADGDSKILETQRMIQSCPSLREGSRRLITLQEAALLSIPDCDIAIPLRVYEQVDDLGLFLFNDALVLTRRSVVHLPFRHGCKTSHTFLASVALHVLTLRDITDTKYVKNAFVLESPKRQWVCATDTEEEKVTWFSALRRAVGVASGEK